MLLSKRMRMNADFIPDKSRVADVGCDHGYVSIYLVQQKKCARVIAMDVGEGPLAIAKKNIAGAGLSEQIECRLSNGLEKLKPGEIDTVLIAGMGGLLICRILQRNPEALRGVDCLVLQPQSDVDAVRRLLPVINFQIEKENFCFDEGKPYFAIQAKRARKHSPVYSEPEYFYGRISLHQNPVEYMAYLRWEREKNVHIIHKLESVLTESSKTRREELLHTLTYIDETLAQSPVKSNTPLQATGHDLASF